MSRLNDRERNLIAEEMLIEADYRRRQRFWDTHWRLLSGFSPKTRNTILDIEVAAAGILWILFCGFIVYIAAIK